MTEQTRKSIKALKASLPGLRERVIAVALLLAMSIAMMSSASFAWLTISRRPQLTGVSTTVAANGNLEIALATGNGKVVPGESKVGDSSAAEGQTVVASNITWGNLINLANDAYGLNNLTLRPAQLNTASLLESPLYGAVYGGDGRITQLSSNFGYAIWNPPTAEKPGYFGVSDQHGVRAISSTKIEAVGAEAKYVNMVTKAKNQNLAAASMYVSLGNNSRYMPSLATMMGLYMTARMNPSNADLSNPTCNIEDIQNLRDMYAAFLDCFDAEAQAMAELLNLQLFLQKGDGNYTPYTAEMIYSTNSAALVSAGLRITNLDQFLKDRNVLVSDLEKLTTICSSGTSLKWKDSGLNDIVNNLVDVGKCTIGSDNTPISSIGASNALSYLSGTQEARITNGVLYRFEERTGGYIQVKNLSIKATVERKGITVPASVKANVQTTASRDYNLYTNDLNYAESLNDGNYKGGVAVAEDTYGLAVDLWVRTNAPATYLTLEGNILSESKEVRATGKDANGNIVEIYTVSVSGEDEEGNPVSYSMDLYQIVTKDASNNDVVTWYNADNHSVVTAEQMGNATPLPKMETIVTVTGYEGENRVWEDNQLLSIDSTTQGSGSCYVYYADTPEDQARSLRLLEAFNVAFVDGNGKLLSTAIMDTEHHYAANGRVTVPLVLSTSDSIDLGEDYEGNAVYGITALEKNVPTRITAIVYLDGTKLTNQEVLAASDIQGQLNIQFGSSQSLEPITNEKLEGAERRVSATVSHTSFDYDTATEPMTTTITVSIDGEKATSVSAFFMRAISNTQGSREAELTFQPDGNGNWVATHTFTTPGKYVLRTVRLDGVDYTLEDPPEVAVAGFALASISCERATENHVTILTAANSDTVNLSLKFATDDEAKLPATVQGRYLRDEDGSAVNIDFSYNSTTGYWTGSATFLTSGDYTLQYLVVNGEYMEMGSAMRQTASVTLGMRVAVYTTSPHSFKYIPTELTENQKLLAMQVKIFDNAGNEMRGLEDIKLTYNMKGSGVKKMDTDLTWNGSYYVGELTTTGPGIWQFGNVVVGQNILTNANTSPTFTILSPEPPEYYDHSTVADQYKPSNDAQMNVQITNSSAATVQAKIVKTGGTEYWVTGTIGGELTTSDGKTANHWYFKVPTDANGYQDGNWTLTELKLWDVFGADGTAYTEEEPLLMDVSDTGNVTRVVSRVFITFPQGKSSNFGKDSAGKVTGAFMDGYEVSGLYVDVKDFENKPISNLSDVKLIFTYNNNSQAYGGYTGATNATADFNIPLISDSTGIRFAQNGAYTLRYAGSYQTTFSFKVGGTEFRFTGDTLPANAPVFTVSSVAPAISLKARSTYEGSSVSGNTITVAYKHSTETTCGITYHNYGQAHVTFTLSGYGSASGASLTFTEQNGGDVRLFLNEQDADNKRVNNFSWTGNGDCKRWVGYWNSQTGSDRATAAGTIIATELVLTYGGANYTVDIDDITIVNPTPPS